MLFKIRHTLRYQYAAPAVLGPQSMHLRPREDGAQRLLDFHLQLDPAPSLVSPCLDENGNIETRAWYTGTTTSLAVTVESTVETLRVNPFDFVVDPSYAALPWGHRVAMDKPVLAPSLEERGENGAASLALALAKEANQDAVSFLLRLNKWIHEKLTYEVRPEGPPQSAAETLHRGRGACRDLTVLFCAAARAVGMPARFVSGYAEGDPDERRKELHAWAEVYLPGAGWRGFDPSSGLACGDRHVALAASPFPADVAAMAGSYGASVAGARLEAEVTFL